MSDEIESLNINVSEFQTGLAWAINQTYSYSNNNLFLATVPAYLRDYALKYVQPACQWLDGYVPSLHGIGTGIISTRAATKLITGLTKQIVGEKLLFKLSSQKDQAALDTLKFVSKWAKEQNIIKAVYGGIGFALGIGTALIKMNKTAKGDIWWQSVRFDQCHYLASFKNEVEDATFLIRAYSDTRQGKSTQQFFLVEHRFYKEYPQGLILKNPDGTYTTKYRKGQRVPMVEYKMHRTKGTSQNNLMASDIQNGSLNWAEIPGEIRKMVKHDFATLRLDEEQELGFLDLGVQALLNGNIDLSVPTATNFGESMIVGIQDDLITYELASSYLIRDMYLGKGTLYLPKSMSINDINPIDIAKGGVMFESGAPQGMPTTPVEMMPGIDPDQQKAIVQQFEIRAAEWQVIKENCLRNIAVKWGMSPKILSSFLAIGSTQMTATQVDSEDDMSIAFIYHTRSYFKDALNKLLETTLNFYGMPANIEISFASPSLINKDRLLNRTVQEMEVGLIDLDDAVRIMNPDDDEIVIQEKVQRLLAQQQQQMMMQQQEFNEEGTFDEE